MSKFLSLDWFKSKIDNAIEKAIGSKIESLINEAQQEEENIQEKPYLNIKRVNDVLTIVLNDGTVVSKPNCSDDDFIRAKNANTKSEILNIVMSTEARFDKEKAEKEVLRIKALKKGMQVLEGLSDFEIKDGSVYLRGTNRSMPQLLVEKFIEIVDSYTSYSMYSEGVLQKVLNDDAEYQAHKRFFMWCCLNPRAEVAHELYRFLTENSFRITKQGFFVALRNVVTLHGSNELVQFVSNAYNKVKAVWKKSPNDYTVFLQNGDYKLVHNDELYRTEVVMCEECEGNGDYWNDETDEYEDCGNCGSEGFYDSTTEINHGQKIGGLTDLYLDLPNRHENRFTDDWTKTFDIRIGKVVNMPKEDCNWSTQDCAAAGLHFTADQIHYVGCGDQSVLVLINPMKVVGIGQHKGRCYEYLPIMTVPREEATSILHDLNFSTLELDEDYAIRELEDLQEKVKEGFAVESRKYEFNIPQMSSIEIKNIILCLDEMKAEMSNRIVNLD